MFFGVRFQTPAPRIRSARISPSLSALPNKGQTPDNAEEETVSCTPGAARGEGLRPAGEGRVEHLFAAGRGGAKGRSRSVQREGGGEATNLPGNASSDLHLLGNERCRGKRGEERSSCERCGEPGAAGSRPPLAAYSGCSTLVLSLLRSPAKPNLARKLRVCMSLFLTQ